MIDEPYRLALAESSKLKLRALAVQAEAGDDAAYRAAVLFHAAARAEQRARCLLEAPAPETRLRSAIEQCGCLIDGLDPRAIEAWGDVLEASEHVPAAAATALRSRIDAGFAAFLERYRDAVEAIPPIAPGTGGLRGSSQQARTRLRRVLATWLAVFPGDPDGWAALSHVDASHGDYESAWQSLARARELDPASSAVTAAALLLVPDALPRARAEEHLDASYASLQRTPASPEVCLAFAISSLRVAGAHAKRKKHVDRALDAIAAGESRPPTIPEQIRVFRALRRIAGEMREGRKPSVDALYRVGLGALAARAAREGEQDPMAILAREVGVMGGVIGSPFRRAA